MTCDFNIMLTEPDGYSSEALGIYQALGEVELGPFNRREILERVGRIHVIVIRLGHQIDNEVICRGKKLQMIVSPTTGLDHIDMEAAERQKIEVISLKGETEFLRGIPATAELSWGLLLAAMRHIPAAAVSASQGVWDRDQFIGQDLKGKMLGIIGLGRIGEKVANYGLAFGMNVEAWDPYREGWMQRVKKADSLESLLANCNVLMVHVPLKPETLDLIGKKQFEAIKPGTVLVNTSRGGIVNEDELIKASGKANHFRCSAGCDPGRS